MPLRAALLATALVAAPVLPEGPPVETRAADVGSELREFSRRAAPPDWSGEIVNGLLGEGLIGQRERREGWLQDPEHWRLLDVADRAHNLTTHGWLAQRGIRADFYGFNEYQETIQLQEGAALALLGERGLGRGVLGELVRDPAHNRDVPEWQAIATGDAFIADPLEPRWSSILRYDLLTSPLFGDALSQDNLGGCPAAVGRFGNAASRGFASWLSRRGAAPLPPLREVLRDRFWGTFARLPPYAPPGTIDPRATSAAAQSLCADPLMAEFQIFLHAANLHAFARHYTDLRRVAARAGRAFDVHGNLGGGIVGASAYPIALGGLVDSIFFETSGVAEYDQIKYGWWNAFGSLRLALAEALAGGRKPAYFVARSERATPDLMALELAEISAGGGVPLVEPDLLAARAPEALRIVEDFLRLRDAERPFFAAHGRARRADVALLYSIPTFLFDPCVPSASSTDTPVLSDLSGAARALEEGHLTYEVVILGHPDLGADAATDDALARHRLVIAPSIENLTESQLALLERYLRGGGTLGVLGRIGVRDERNRARPASALERLRNAGRVRVLLGGQSFPHARLPESAYTHAQSARFLGELGELLLEREIEAALPRTLWVKTWTHRGGRVSAHFVNYAFEARSGRAQPTLPVPLRMRLAAGAPPRVVRWLVPGQAERALPFRVRDGVLELELPSVSVYGVLALGAVPPRRSGDRVAGALARERAHEAEIQRLADFGKPVLALAFGAASSALPWHPVGPGTQYRPELGYGWLASDDDSHATPEERSYRGAAEIDADVLRGVSLLNPYWPWQPSALPAPLQNAVVSGRAQRLRLDLADGLYRVSVVTTNGSWNQRNFLVSGMVRADGRPVLLDTPLDRGGLARRAFTTRVSGGRLELGFGGPTGFGVAALLVERADAEPIDPLETGGVRAWSVSARHANPDWVELDDVVVPARETATLVGAAERGLPLVDLGSVAQAQIGDVVVARTELDRTVAGEATLSVGASSAAHVYLNGERVLVVPNVKGVERDEGVARIRLRAGRNELALVLERFWERRWMFYASVH